MGITPKLIKEKKFKLKQCSCCGQSFGPENFTPTRSFLYLDGAIPICDSCVMDLLSEQDFNWKIVNKLCQMVDIPFVPTEFEKLHEQIGDNVFHHYAEIFLDSQYDELGWEDYFERYKELKQSNYIDDELPELAEAKHRTQRERWGGAYDYEALDYLDNLYNGMLSTQNVNGALQIDQAIKICKMSYEIDKRIEEGADFDKLLGAYDKLVKAAEFTPKNVKNLNDFDSFGEVIKWLEKRGWRNTFYDNVTRDIVDETIKNLQNFNQRLYTNESGIGDEINRRIEQLKTAKELENYYGTDQKNDDLDQYDNEGFNDLFKDESDDFDIDLSGGDDIG